MGETIANNKKAFHEYEILDKLEVGLELIGSEVKSIRARKVSIKEGFIKIIKGEAWIFSMHIGTLSTTVQAYAPDEKRTRRLLMHKKEILKWEAKVKLDGYTIVPLRIYFNSKNLAKMQIGLGRGLKNYDKREVMKKKDADRRSKQAVKNYLNS
jgi:SsrA-binding protein